MRPAEEKSVDRPESAAQIGVFAACFRNHGAEFGERERAKYREDGADNPRGKNNGDAFAFARHFRGLQEMPVPIMVPTTMAAEAQAPKPRTKSSVFSLIKPFDGGLGR